MVHHLSSRNIIDQREDMILGEDGHVSHPGGSIDLVNMPFIHTQRIETAFRCGVRAVGGLRLSDFFSDFNEGGPSNRREITLASDPFRWGALGREHDESSRGGERS